MSKMIIMKGLPASGKSTKAKEIQEKMGNCVRINKDLLRTMLHFDKWSGKNEGLTKDASRALVKHYLTSGMSVIIDDTNLNEGTVQGWKDLAKECDAKIEYEVMDTPWWVCIERDNAREKKVGSSVIMNMAFSSGLYPKPDKPIVLCDLDGTLCDINHRLHFVKAPLVEHQSEEDGEPVFIKVPDPDFKKDWKSFFAGIKDDKINIAVDLMLKGYLNNGHQIVLVSARPDTYRKETEEWLKANGIIFPVALFMRRGDDKRPDTDVKKGMYESLFKGKYDIECVIDDRPSVIRMWKELGLKVVDVGSGKEF